MPEKGIGDIPRPTKELYDKGMAALQKQNLDYALAIFNQVLANEPGFYECREALRATQFKKAGAKGGIFKRLFGTASASSQVAKGQLHLRNNPPEAMKIAESILNQDPANTGAHRLLAQAALAMDLPRTAVLSLEIVFKNNSNDRDAVLELAQALVATGQVDRAEKILEDLQSVFPNDNEIAQALKNASARRTMKHGGYESVATGDASYRDLLKDKEEAVSLEQENREVKSEEVLDRLVREQEAQLVHEPKNLRLIRSLADLYTQKKEFDRAIALFEKVTETEGANDPSLQRAIAQTKLRQFDHRISQLDPVQPEQAAEIEALRKGRQEYQLQECRQRVERYPNDLQIRFELGELYFNAGLLNEAIQEFQKAQNNPNRRIAALRYLGQCFLRRGMHDLAVRTFQNAIKEKAVFDEEKKELVYLLGTAFEGLGQREQAIEQFKIIYEADIGFRDVAAKVDAYYASK